MYKRKDIFNLVYIFVFLVVASIGLNNSLGISSGNFKPPIFYTSLSGLICFIYFFIAFVRGLYFLISKKEFPNSLFLLPRMKGAVTICITVTLLVYHFLVYEGPMLSIDMDIFNFFPHYVVPIMVIIHWIAFDKKGVYTKIDPLLWTIIPISYFSWANIVAYNNQVIPYWEPDFYPYSFMDLTKNSIQSVVMIVIALFAFFIILGYIVVYIDNRDVKKKY